MLNQFYFNMNVQILLRVGALIDVKKGNYNNSLLNDAYEMIKDCEKVLENKWENKKLEDLKKFELYHEFLFGSRYVSDKSRWKFEEILQKKSNEIKNIKKTLESVLKKERVSKKKIDEGLGFLNQLHRICVKYVPYIMD